jgi:hypothetical protein
MYLRNYGFKCRAWESSLAALGVFQRVSPDHSVEGESGG